MQRRILALAAGLMLTGALAPAAHAQIPKQKMSPPGCDTTVGNVVRGVPLNKKHEFFEPLWTDFLVGDKTGILDWYTILVGVLTVTALAHHGSLWLNARAEGLVRERANKAAGALWIVRSSTRW